MSVMKLCRHLLAPMILLVAPAFADEGKWFLLSREDGCVDIKLLVKAENLRRVPRTPEEFAELMRDRGYRVTVGLPDGFPPELEEKAVIVKVRDNMAPVFVREELCKKLEEQQP